MAEYSDDAMKRRAQNISQGNPPPQPQDQAPSIDPQAAQAMSRGFNNSYKLGIKK